MQLNAALKAISDPNQWTKAVPLVLLGIRTSIKQNIKCTSAELVYSTTLHIPGEFFVLVINSYWILLPMLTN